MTKIFVDTFQAGMINMEDTTKNLEAYFVLNIFLMIYSITFAEYVCRAHCWFPRGEPWV